MLAEEVRKDKLVLLEEEWDWGKGNLQRRQHVQKPGIKRGHDVFWKVQIFYFVFFFKWVGSLSLLQGIFVTQKLNQSLLHCRQILYQLSYQGSPLGLICEFKMSFLVFFHKLNLWAEFMGPSRWRACYGDPTVCESQSKPRETEEGPPWSAFFGSEPRLSEKGQPMVVRVS